MEKLQNHSSFSSKSNIPYPISFSLLQDQNKNMVLDSNDDYFVIKPLFLFVFLLEVHICQYELSKHQSHTKTHEQKGGEH